MAKYSKALTCFLMSRKVTHRLVEFDEPVKTVERNAGRLIEKIVKSIVMIASNCNPILALVPATSYRV